MSALDAQLDDLLQLFGSNPLVHAAILVAVTIVLAKIIDWIVDRGLRVWARRSATDLDDRLLQLLHKPVFLSVLLIGLYLALQRLELSSGVHLFYGRVLKTLAVLVWTQFALRSGSILLDTLSRLEQRFTIVQPRTVSLFDQIAKIVLAGGAVYLLLVAWGVDPRGWLAGAGIVGIAVGFAAKDTLANLFSGLFILADAPYQIGDFIVLDSGERGVVTQIGLRSTRLLTRDDIEVTIPNAVIANAKITNESGGRWEKERVRLRVSVAYGSDIDRVRELLLTVARSHPEIDAEPEPRVRFRAFGDSGLQLELLGWIHQPVLRGRVLDALNTEVYKRFAQEGIEIPFPKRDVYLHGTATDSGR